MPAERAIGFLSKMTLGSYKDRWSDRKTDNREKIPVTACFAAATEKKYTNRVYRCYNQD